MIYTKILIQIAMVQCNYMSHAFSVTDLQSSIASETGVSEDSQLLLVSGGVTMEPSHIVCNYGAGTVSKLFVHIVNSYNLVFLLFSKFTADNPPCYFYI